MVVLSAMTKFVILIWILFCGFSYLTFLQGRKVEERAWLSGAKTYPVVKGSQSHIEYPSQITLEKVRRPNHPEETQYSKYCHGKIAEVPPGSVSQGSTFEEVLPSNR